MIATKKMSKSSSYNQIAKATGVFGGVQVINILISIVRSKFVAVLLGTAGVGISGLFTAATGLIASLTNLGISFSAVRTISAAAGSNNETVISRTVITHNRWVIFTGLAGAFLTLILAPQLSNWSFGNSDYTWAFVWLSVTLIFQALNNGQLALLQGLRRIKQLAKANVLGSFFGLCVSVPLYFWLGIKGIVPALIITAFISLLLSWYFTKKVAVKKVSVSIKESFTDGLDMVKLGSVMMLTGFVSTGVMYLIRLYISRNGGVEQVGLYTAAWAILNGYVGMVFSAMATDYFPRLSAVHRDNDQVKKLVNEQAEIAVLILGPILILLLSALPIIIKVLFTDKFLPILDLIQWALVGVLFKAASWAIGFILLAKGVKKIYFTVEMTANVIIVISNIILYHFFGLEGIGFAFLISYFLYLIIVFAIVNVKYHFRFSPSFIKLFLVQGSLTVGALMMVLQSGFPNAYFSGAFLLLLSLLYSYYEFKKRIDLSIILQRFKWKK